MIISVLYLLLTSFHLFPSIYGYVQSLEGDATLEFKFQGENNYFGNNVTFKDKFISQNYISPQNIVIDDNNRLPAGKLEQIIVLFEPNRIVNRTVRLQIWRQIDNGDYFKLVYEQRTVIVAWIANAQSLKYVFNVTKDQFYTQGGDRIGISFESDYINIFFNRYGNIYYSFQSIFPTVGNNYNFPSSQKISASFAIAVLISNPTSTGATGSTVTTTTTTGSTVATGWTGATGYTGATGFTGFPGFPGNQGNTGASGSLGAPGYTGFTGLRGSIGGTGFTGNKGNTGPYGVTGPQGSTGSTGSSGITGEPGGTGAPGTTGVKGPPGDPGPMGPKGLIGPPGLSSEGFGTGATGSTGATGATGFTGFQGPMGINYSENISGLPGYIGPKGPTGDTGATGSPGPPGENLRISNKIMQSCYDPQGSVSSADKKIHPQCPGKPWAPILSLNGSIEYDKRIELFCDARIKEGLFKNISIVWSLNHIPIVPDDEQRMKAVKGNWKSERFSLKNNRTILVISQLDAEDDKNWINCAVIVGGLWKTSDASNEIILNVKNIPACKKGLCEPFGFCNQSTNDPNRYNCICKTGFRNINPTSCEDIDECKNIQPHNMCINTPGSFIFSCSNVTTNFQSNCIYEFTQIDLINISTSMNNKHVFVGMTAGGTVFCIKGQYVGWPAQAKLTPLLYGLPIYSANAFNSTPRVNDSACFMSSPSLDIFATAIYNISFEYLHGSSLTTKKTEYLFQYIKNPVITSIDPDPSKIFYNGDQVIYLNGTNFEGVTNMLINISILYIRYLNNQSTEKRYYKFQICKIESDMQNRIMCHLPNFELPTINETTKYYGVPNHVLSILNNNSILSNISKEDSLVLQLNYKFIFNYDTSTYNGAFQLDANHHLPGQPIIPIFLKPQFNIYDKVMQFDVFNQENIRIMGQNLNLQSRDAYNCTIGGVSCIISSINSNQLNCIPHPMIPLSRYKTSNCFSYYELKCQLMSENKFIGCVKLTPNSSMNTKLLIGLIVGLGCFALIILITVIAIAYKNICSVGGNSKNKNRDTIELQDDGGLNKPSDIKKF